ncbi:MAG: complex I NDUFA9 subunit family protein [Gemmatimonadota bacterium]
MHDGSPFHSSSGFASSAPGSVVEPAVEPMLAALSEPRRVLVTGTTGFVGRHLVDRLLARGHRVTGLSRAPAAGPAAAGVRWRRGDVARAETLRDVARDCDVVVHLAGAWESADVERLEAVHVRGTENLLNEASRWEVSRFVYVSALGANPGGPAFLRTKYEAERLVRDSALEHVILRPSVIYGPGDHFTTRLAGLLRRLPVFPVLGSGSLRLQPVSVEDVSDVLMQAVERSDVRDSVFELAGPERLKFTKIVRIVARALDLRRPVVQVPRWLAGPTLWLAGRCGLSIPIISDQMELFRDRGTLRREDNSLRTVFHIEPLPFQVAVVDYLGASP